jgi:hypothetical protein
VGVSTMGVFSAPEYRLARLVFERLLALTYLVAFVGTALQFRALLGEQGLLPVPRFVQAISFRRAPSIFHLHYSDRFPIGLAWVGAILALSVVIGVPQQAAVALHVGVGCPVGPLSLVRQRGPGLLRLWLGTLLLEAGFLAIFVGNAETAPPLLIILLVRWLLFRLEFGAGLIKLRHDPCWRDLSCLDYHHETQPIPNRLSWYFPPSAQAAASGGGGGQPLRPARRQLRLFAPQAVASVAGGAILATQAWLLLSGNYAWLNLLTIALTAMSFHDGVLGQVIPVDPPPLQPAPSWFAAAAVLVTLAIAALSYRSVRNMASRHQLMNASFDPLRLVNTYGVFGRVTRERYEVVIEGTDEPALGPGTLWREYEFKAKPGDTRRRPRQIAPYHLRLDWLMWFAALSPVYAEAWMLALVEKLLKNDPRTLRLLATNPFPDAAPTFVRALLYRYRFTTRQERRETGAWWVPELVGEYLPPLALYRPGVLDAETAPPEPSRR